METGHLSVFEIVETPFHEYLKHERHHDETLLIACHHGQDAVVELLLGQRTFGFSDHRALMIACASDNASILERLLQAENMMLPTKDGRIIEHEILYQAASNGHKQIVETLLERSVQASASDTATGLTCLQAAAKNGHLQIVRALCTAGSLQKVPRGPDIDPPHAKMGMKALHYAAADGHDEIVAFLIQRGLECNERNLLGETALIKASQNGHAMVAKVLLEGGADPLLRGGEPWYTERPSSSPLAPIEEGYVFLTPVAFHHAASNGHANVLAILPYSDLNCGASETKALHLGAPYGHLDVVQALLFQGAKIESVGSRGMTALHHASRNGHNLVVKLQLDRGCRIDRRTDQGRPDQGRTALHFAAQAIDIKTIRGLVACGADINARTADPESYKSITAANSGAAFADLETIEVLLQGVGGRGCTALEEAIACNRRASVSALIELGAEWIRGEVFALAGIRADCEIVEMLLGKLSTATAKARVVAAAMFRMTLAEGASNRNEKAVRIFGDFARLNFKPIGSFNQG